MNAIYYCKECCHAKETKKEYIGKRAKCPACSSSIKIYDSIEFIEQLAKKNLFQSRELSKIKQDFKDKEERELEELEDLKKNIQKLKQSSTSNKIKIVNKAINN
jgi:tRNA G26 N,N-dimethylase Trm1